jgi:hypothetical protein
MNNFKIDQSMIDTAKEILSGIQDRIKLLENSWGEVTKEDVFVLIDNKNLCVTPKILMFVLSYYEEMHELKYLRKTARSIKFKINEFYGIKTNSSAKWDERFDKAKALDIRHVISVLTGETNFKYNISCKFHDDKQPSMKVYDESFYCFSCGKGGTVVDFVMHLKEIKFKEAINFLSDNF